MGFRLIKLTADFFRFNVGTRVLWVGWWYGGSCCICDEMEEGSGGDRMWVGDTARLLDGDMDRLSDPFEALDVEGDRS